MGLAAMRDIGSHGGKVIGLGYSATALASTSKYCTAHYLRAQGERAVVHQVIELARTYGASMLIAMSEPDIALFNRHREQLSKHIRLLFPEADTINQIFDTKNALKQAASVGIQTPKTVSISNMENIESVLGDVTYPVVLKWADPNAVASRLHKVGLKVIKAEYAKSFDELIGKLGKYSTLNIFPMIQEYCKGEGLGHMFLMYEGQALLEFQHHRIHEWEPEGGVSSLCMSVPLNEHVRAREKSRVLLEKLNWTGVAMVEYRYDVSSGTYLFMEVNGRFWGSLPLAIAAGVPFATGLVVSQIINDVTQFPKVFQAPYKRIKCLYFIPETKRLVRILFERKKIKDPLFKPRPFLSLLRYCFSFLSPYTHYYVFEWVDQRPFWSDVKNILWKLLKQ